MGRFIPTHTGNTLEWDQFCIDLPVHPHTHGEHSGTFSGLAALSGSSPHTWGTLSGHRTKEYSGRFIPTHMGNTTINANRPAVTLVHPHTHGEHAKLRPFLCPFVGSSPHTWGTLRPALPAPISVRFIPTHMGNTLVCLFCRT